ncbi:MAG TPA: Wzz/FepE/Etk N-terminal domain-containing protein [Flavobacteriales bacterium]|jgi:hypothetical protein|nr:Wzz/FepE/Etk N-terminal domain-containing protein [Flavobacteriales bacterium]
MRDRLSFGDLFSVLGRHWKSFALVGLAAIVLSAIFSGPSFITPRYRSTATVYPVNLTSYSQETRTDQLLQLLESNSIRDSLIARFDLAKRYKVDTTGNGWRFNLYNTLLDRLDISKTRYESVQIELEDEDPAMARDMVQSMLDQADQLARRLQREKSQELLVIAKRNLDRAKGKLDSVEVALDTLRAGGILNYDGQSRELVKGYVRMLNSGASQGQKDEVRRMLKELEDKGGEFRLLMELSNIFRADYAKYLADYEQQQVDVSKVLTYTNTVIHPEVADRKIYPVRWLIVVIGTVSALLLCYLFYAYKDLSTDGAAKRP